LDENEDAFLCSCFVTSSKEQQNPSFPGLQQKPFGEEQSCKELHSAAEKQTILLECVLCYLNIFLKILMYTIN